MKRWILLAVMLIAALILAACGGAGAQPTEEAVTEEPIPTVDPNLAAGGGISLALPDFGEAIKNAVRAGDTQSAAGFMADPHIIGFFQSESTTLPSAEAATQLMTIYKAPECTIDFPAAPADIATRMGGTDPLTMWDPAVTIVDAIYSTGWGMTCDGEAYLVLSQHTDGFFYWYGTLLAPDGFAMGPAGTEEAPTQDGSGAAGTPISDEGDLSSLEGIQQVVKLGIANNDFELLALAMDDPFGFAFWRSEGFEMSPIESASALLSEQYKGAACTITYPEPPADLQTRMDGMTPLDMWNPAANVQGWLFSTGWGQDCTNEAILVFNEVDGVFAWYSILISQGPFQ